MDDSPLLNPRASTRREGKHKRSPNFIKCVLVLCGTVWQLIKKERKRKYFIILKSSRIQLALANQIFFNFLYLNYQIIYKYQCQAWDQGCGVSQHYPKSQQGVPLTLILTIILLEMTDQVTDRSTSSGVQRVLTKFVLLPEEEIPLLSVRRRPLARFLVVVVATADDRDDLGDDSTLLASSCLRACFLSSQYLTKYLT